MHSRVDRRGGAKSGRSMLAIWTRLGLKHWFHRALAVDRSQFIGQWGGENRQSLEFISVGRVDGEPNLISW